MFLLCENVMVDLEANFSFLLFKGLTSFQCQFLHQLWEICVMQSRLGGKTKIRMERLSLLQKTYGGGDGGGSHHIYKSFLPLAEYGSECKIINICTLFHCKQCRNTEDCLLSSPIVLLKIISFPLKTEVPLSFLSCQGLIATRDGFS